MLRFTRIVVLFPSNPPAAPQSFGQHESTVACRERHACSEGRTSLLIPSCHTEQTTLHQSHSLTGAREILKLEPHISMMGCKCAYMYDLCMFVGQYEQLLSHDLLTGNFPLSHVQRQAKNGCGSTMGTQNGTLVNGTHD